MWGKLLRRKMYHISHSPNTLFTAARFIFNTRQILWKRNTFFSVSWHISAAFITLVWTGYALSCLRHLPSAPWLTEPPSQLSSAFSTALQSAALQLEPRGDQELINGLQLTKRKRCLLSRTAQCQLLQQERGSRKNMALPLFPNK